MSTLATQTLAGTLKLNKNKINWLLLHCCFLQVGGNSNNGSIAGLSCTNSNNTFSNSNTNIGARLTIKDYYDLHSEGAPIPVIDYSVSLALQKANRSIGLLKPRNWRENIWAALYNRGCASKLKIAESPMRPTLWRLT